MFSTFLDNLYNTFSDHHADAASDANVDTHKLVRTSETTSSFQLNQGNEYLQNKSRSSIRPKINSNNSLESQSRKNCYNWKGDILEGNSGMIGITKTEIANNESVKETNQFIDKYRQDISDYAFKHKFLMDKTNNYLTRAETKNPYVGKNVRLNDGQLGYVTAKGVFKWYPSQSVYEQTAGKNGCPSEIINVNTSSNNKFNTPNEIIYADYPLRVGTEMKMGQSCGNEGTNVFVSQATEQKNVAEKYTGCYRKTATGLDFQSDMGDVVSIESCKTRAIDNGSSGFAVSTNGSSRKCYTVSNPTGVYSGGIATKTNTSYKLIQTVASPGTASSTTGGLLLDGTIGIGNSSNFKTDNDTKSAEYVSKSLFASNSLYSGCTNSGALVNSADTIASYGSNCTNKIMPPAKPKPVVVSKAIQWQVDKNKQSEGFTGEINGREDVIEGLAGLSADNGSALLLETHNVDCGDNGIKRFKLSKKADGSYRYDYSCSAPFENGANMKANEIKGTETKSTALNEDGSVFKMGGNTIFLDRHQVDCGEGGAISQFQLSRAGTPNKYQYNYKCVKMGKPMTSRMITTTADDVGGGNATFLDRHDVVCADDEAMNYFALIRPSEKQIAYKYRCSKFLPAPEAPSAPKSAPIPPGPAEAGFSFPSKFLLGNPKKDNLCLDDGGGTRNGQTKFHLWNCDRNNVNQHFTYDAATKQLKNPNKNLCVDDGGGTSNGQTKFHLWDCDKNNKNQQFDYDPNSKMFKNPNKSKCMDDGGGTRNGQTKFHLWDCDPGCVNQKFEPITLDAKNKPPTNDLRQIPGSLKQVDIDGNIVCGVNGNDDIFCKDNLDQGNWTQVPGSLKHVSVSNGKLYGVNSGDDIFYADNYKSANWRKIPGSLKQVDIGGNEVCGVNRDDVVFCKKNLDQGNWTKLPGSLKHVSVRNGNIYGVNSNDNIYIYNYGGGEWKQIPGALKQVNIDGNTVCGVNRNDDIFCKDNLDLGNWTQVPGSLKHVSVSNGKLYGVNRDDRIFYAKI
jgi:hypothetical protein